MDALTILAVADTDSTPVSPRSHNPLATQSPFPSYTGFTYAGSAWPISWAALGTPAYSTLVYYVPYLALKLGLFWAEAGLGGLQRSLPTCTVCDSVSSCSGLFLAGHQVPTKAALSLAQLSWTGERKYNERLVGQDKDRKRSFSNYHHRQNRLDLGKFIASHIRVA